MAKEYGIDAVKKELLEHMSLTANMLFRQCDRMTPIEGIVLITLYQTVYNGFGENNVRIRPQVPIDQYVVDFLIEYEPLEGTEVTKKIVIECDGHDYHERTKEQATHDKSRDRHLIKKGYTVLRYTGSEIVNDRFKIAKDVEELMIPEHKKYGYGYGEEFENEMKKWREDRASKSGTV